MCNKSLQNELRYIMNIIENLHFMDYTGFYNNIVNK